MECGIVFWCIHFSFQPPVQKILVYYYFFFQIIIYYYHFFWKDDFHIPLWSVTKDLIQLIIGRFEESAAFSPSTWWIGIRLFVVLDSNCWPCFIDAAQLMVNKLIILCFFSFCMVESSSWMPLREIVAGEQRRWPNAGIGRETIQFWYWPRHRRLPGTSARSRRGQQRLFFYIFCIGHISEATTALLRVSERIFFEQSMNELV